MNNSYSWYQKLAKPPWAPPPWLFGPVWTVLYIIIAISFGYVFYQTINRKLSWFVALPFILNIFFNFLFTPIQFGLRNNLLALIDILLVLVTLIWAMTVTYSHVRWVTFVNIPYLLWLIFATYLQLQITLLNR